MPKVLAKKNESQGEYWEKWDLCHSTWNVWIYIAKFFIILVTVHGNVRIMLIHTHTLNLPYRWMTQKLKKGKSDILITCLSFAWFGSEASARVSSVHQEHLTINRIYKLYWYFNTTVAPFKQNIHDRLSTQAYIWLVTTCINTLLKQCKIVKIQLMEIIADSPDGHVVRNIYFTANNWNLKLNIP